MVHRLANLSANRLRRWSGGWLLLAVVSAGVPMGAQEPPTTGAIQGMVRYVGVVPPPRQIVTTDGATLLHHDLVVDAKSKGLRFAVAYLENAPAVPVAKNAKAVVIDQRDLLFTPRVAAAQAGQKVRFENNDNFNHAVQSVTSNVDNLFNVVTPQGQPFEFEFKAQRNPVQIGCPIHPWMRAWIVVLPHPFAAVTDEHGKFRIEGAPAGNYKLVVMHPDTARREFRNIEITPGKTTAVKIEWTTAK